MAGNGWMKPRVLCALGATALLGAAAVAQGTGALPALARLEPGLWQIRDLDSASSAPERICISDPAMLMQLQHRNSSCSRQVISSEAASAKVHYTCPANGFGTTSVRVETPRLAKIDTQGIMDKIPFAFRAEVRRIGNCPSANGGR
jgi:hypothetical protein